MLLCINARDELQGVNPFGCELVGQSEQQLLGKRWFEAFVDPDQRKKAGELSERIFRGNPALNGTFDFQLKRPSGELRRFAWRPAREPAAFDEDQVYFILGQDVTERDKARHDLDTAERQMHAVVESAADGIITIDHRGIIQTVNQAGQNLFGYTSDELVGRNVSMLMPSPDRERHDGYLAKYIETGVAGIIGKGREVVALKKDGTEFPIYLAVSEVKDGVHLFTGIVRDLTHEKELQGKLQQQEALATLGKMAAVVAHEVRNPLAGIAGVIQILRGRAEKSGTEYAIMGDVLERIDALVETISDLLLYARPRDLRRQPIRVTDLLAESGRLVKADPQSGEIEIEVADSDAVVHIDLEYLREAVLNLMLNAAQAMGGKGAIRTEIEKCDDHCCVRILDAGPGIPADIRGKVFEPFFTTKGRGTGLGLALVKRVAERHGGALSIKCPESGGTVVTLKLPYHVEGAE